jgi:hypothetical protein
MKNIFVKTFAILYNQTINNKKNSGAAKNNKQVPTKK